MFNKKINTINLLVTGLFFIVLGILIIFEMHLVASIFLLLIGLGIIISDLIVILTSKKIEIKKFINVLFGIILISVRDSLVPFLNILFGIYFMLITIIYFIEWLIYLKNNINGKVLEIIKIIILITLTILIFIPNREVTGPIIGVYLILLGLDDISHFLSEINSKFKKNIEIPLPVLLNAFIPKKLIKEIDKAFLEENSASLDKIKKNVTSDIEVLIHLAPSGTAAMGHVEISFEGKTYSYGNYNMHSRALFDAIGDGIVMVADRDKYIDYAINQKNRYIVSFGILLTNDEKQAIQLKINELLKDTIEYYPDQALADQGKLENKKYTDMSSELYMYADSKFYKIIKGNKKKFFVLMTNCAAIAEYILSSTGNKILPIDGILTPGTYFEYLNGSFMMKNTNVISRKIYTKKSID